jgi:hypothetical protein
MVVKQFGWGVDVESLPLIGYVMSVLLWCCLRVLLIFGLFVDFNRLTRKHQIVWVLYGQASRAISMG